MYYDIEEAFREPEPDVDEELRSFEERLRLAEDEYDRSSKTPEDRKKYDYIRLAVADNKNRLLEKKLQKKEIEFIKLKSERDHLREAYRYAGAEKIFLWLLCGLGSFALFLPAVFSSLLFPKEQGRFWCGSFYVNHPYIYSAICFLIVAIVTLVIKLI